MNRIKEFLFLNLEDYENIGVSFPIGAVILGFAIGIAVFLFYYNYRRSCMSCLCTRLLRAEAFSPEKARKLKDLRLDGSWGVKMALGGEGELAAVIKRVDAKESACAENPEPEQKENNDSKNENPKKKTKEEKIDFSTALFYINPEFRGRAEKIAKQNNSIVMPCILYVVMLAILVLSFLFLPDLLSFINGKLGA